MAVADRMAAKAWSVAMGNKKENGVERVCVGWWVTVAQSRGGGGGYSHSSGDDGYDGGHHTLLLAKWLSWKLQYQWDQNIK